MVRVKQVVEMSSYCMNQIFTCMSKRSCCMSVVSYSYYRCQGCEGRQIDARQLHIEIALAKWFLGTTLKYPRCVVVNKLKTIPKRSSHFSCYKFMQKIQNRFYLKLSEVDLNETYPTFFHVLPLKMLYIIPHENENIYIQ